MRRFPSLAALLLPSLLSAAALAAPLAPPPKDPRGAQLVDVQWLAQHLKDPNLVLLHVGDPKSEKDYPAAHLPGARPVSMGDVSVGDKTGKGLVLEMPPPEELRKALEGLGISDDSRVIVYYSPSSRCSSPRW